MRRDKEREKETEKRIARLYWEYRGRIWYQANKRLQNEQDAEDIVQEVFMYLIQNKGELNQVPESRISSYLYIIIKRLCEEYEKRRNEGEVSLYGVRNIYQMNVGESVTTEQIVIDREMLRSLLWCFGKLPERSQMLLRYRLASGSSSAELAKEMHISQNTFDARVSRVRKKLKKLWKREGKWNG
ncbi:MAG: sigma-70 family RNA polymerase sigma factor [Lachnospiraceae bacterium]|nr:sigma-70 family RNA polymerase sigma factor [Lachnospiraceae bacterium]